MFRTRILRCLLLRLLLSAAVSPVLGQYSPTSCDICKIWNAPQEPFKIYGNSYYVGTHGLSSILITSSGGHVLIDGDLPESAQQIREHIEKLGFRIEDVKAILNSHVHFDHAGGIAQLQRWSGASVAASEWSAGVLREGSVGRDDPQYGILPSTAKVTHVNLLRDGMLLKVGGVLLTAHLTPGHTPGGTSWTWRSCEGFRCVNMVFADSLTAASAPGFKFTAHPDLLKGFAKSFTWLDNTPCDVLITTHPDISGLWERLELRNQGATPDPMVDSGACRRLADKAREQLRTRIQSESQQ